MSMILSWYEQKAVCILLTLLHLGIKNIKLGPSLPAFITPAALNILVEKFNIAPTTTAEADLKAILQSVITSYSIHYTKLYESVASPKDSVDRNQLRCPARAI